MSTYIGTTTMGIRAPIIKEGDAIEQIVTDSLNDALTETKMTLDNKDIIAISEAVVARSQGNFASVDDIAADLCEKFNGQKIIGVLFPILSRNRFSLILKSIARSMEHIHLMMSYPSDEVGNRLVSDETVFEHNVNPYGDTLNERQFRHLFGYEPHPFTGVDYIEFYRQLIEAEECTVEFHFSNDPTHVLKHVDHALACDIHSRALTKKKLIKAGAKTVLTLQDVLDAQVNESGYNPSFGLLGSNKSTEERLKLFPKDGFDTVKRIQKSIKERFNVMPEVMIYGDGAFKDPVGGIWELADPVVSPGYTAGLEGSPNELKLKYLADNEFSDLEGDALQKAMKEKIKHKNKDLKGTMAAQGTTPRRYVDLIGSLSDLTSGSGDKGTPIVLIRNYFSNYAD